MIESQYEAAGGGGCCGPQRRQRPLGC